MKVSFRVVLSQWATTGYELWIGELTTAFFEANHKDMEYFSMVNFTI